MGVKKHNIAIIGGGITGLATAFYLLKKAGGTFDFTLFEQSERLGGKIQTVKRNGFIIERGPDSIVARKPAGVSFIKDVGLEADLVGNSAGQSYVWHRDDLYPIPGGAMMGIPTEIGPFIHSKLFSFKGKARAAFDLLLPRQSRKNQDISLGYFFRKRLGDEVVEHLIEPLLSGIYSGDIDELSLMSTFPQFFEVEQKYRSLILGMKKKKPKTTEKQESAFVTLRNGLESLVAKVEELLPAASIRKRTAVDKIKKKRDGYELQLESGEKRYFDAIVITSPHTSVRHMLRDYSFVHILTDYPVTSVANVAMAFEEEQVKFDYDGTGFVVSRKTDVTITACTWTNRKWPHTTPKGKVLLRGYVGRPGQTDIVDVEDEEMTEVVLQDLKKIMKIEGKPLFHIITRWKHAMPQYTVGHKFRIDALKSNLEIDLPGVFLAGSSFEGVGIPDCIQQAKQAVEKVIAFFD